MKKLTEKILLNLVAAGEDSYNQFKVDVTNPDALAAEMVAMLNANGGRIYIGVGDDGSIAGLNSADVRRINQMISSVTTQHIKNPVTVTTENVILKNKRIVIVVNVPEGFCKPYFDKSGIIWLKEGADKRRAVSREEIRRFFQSSRELPADEQSTRATFDDLNVERFKTFFTNTYGESFPVKKSEQLRLLKNLNLADNEGCLNLAGLLIFGDHPEFLLPQFGVKAVRFDGLSLSSTLYLDSEDYNGCLGEIYKGVMAFIMRNLHKRQKTESVNM
jgi:ATP-dependent DNA helicase RecG